MSLVLKVLNYTRIHTITFTIKKTYQLTRYNVSVQYIPAMCPIE